MGSIRDGVLAGRSKLIWGRTLTLFFLKTWISANQILTILGVWAVAKVPETFAKGGRPRPTRPFGRVLGAPGAAQTFQIDDFKLATTPKNTCNVYLSASRALGLQLEL